MKSITLVGGGLAGSLVSVYLAKRGYEVNIYERRPDMRNVKIPAGRSINLALSTRGISALKKVGLDQAVLGKAIPMPGRMM
ncbi:NAD(P)-binding protein, partial [Bacteroidia bacterium]|nr:NAD(P)-binding protein [Bacteroidia bacterium]